MKLNKPEKTVLTQPTEAKNMKKVTPYVAVLVFLFCSQPTYAVEDYSAQLQPKRSSSTTQAKSHTKQTSQKTQLSRKCGIYSGICPMRESSEVGAYCICNTPSGPIHGVVVP